jgi:hypothetical protein
MEAELEKLTLEHRVLLRERKLFVGGSDARIIAWGVEAASVRPLKTERGEAEPKIRRANLRFRIFATSRQRPTSVSSPRPGSSVVGWFFKLFICFLHPRARNRTLTPPPFSRMKTNPAASIADRNTSTMLSRKSRPVSNRLTVTPALAASTRPAMLQLRSTRATRP